MTVLCENSTETLGTIVQGIHEIRPTVASVDGSSCPSTSTDDQQEHATKRNTHGGKLIKENMDASLIRKTTAFIADALLQLGGSEDGGSIPSCDESEKTTKRTISDATDTDAYSTDTQSTNSETDIKFIHTNKRHRKTPSQVRCSIPTNLCLPVFTKPAHYDFKTRKQSKLSGGDEKEQTTSFSTREFQIQSKNVNENKLPGDIGSIFQSFDQGFRPLKAAPRLPQDIVPEFLPPMHSMFSPYETPATALTMHSSDITEHNDFLIMHSYTLLPRMIPSPYHMSRTQLRNGI